MPFVIFLSLLQLHDLLLITPPRQRTPRAPCRGRGAGLVAVARLPAVSDMCQGRPRGSQLQLRAALGHQSRDLGRLCDAAAARRRARALDDVSRRPTRTRHLFLVAMHLFLVASLFKNSIQALRACACAPSAPWQFDCFPHDGIAAIDMPITTCSDWTKTRIKKPKTKKKWNQKMIALPALSCTGYIYFASQGSAASSTGTLTCEERQAGRQSSNEPRRLGPLRNGNGLGSICRKIR